MVVSHIDSVKIIRNSAPYINAHRGKTFVLMFGGEAIEEANFANIIHDIALLNSLGVRLVLVHVSARRHWRHLHLIILRDIRDQSFGCEKQASNARCILKS